MWTAYDFHVGARRQERVEVGHDRKRHAGLLAQRRDPQRTLSLDMEFHRSIVEASAGPRLLAMYNGIKPQTERYWRVYSPVQTHVDKSAEEHEENIPGIEEGNPDMGERGIVMNWQRGWERLCEVIDTIGERGSW